MLFRVPAVAKASMLIGEATFVGVPLMMDSLVNMGAVSTRTVSIPTGDQYLQVSQGVDLVLLTPVLKTVSEIDHGHGG